MEEGTTREEGVLGFVNERTNKGNKKGGEVLPDDPIDGIGNGDGPKLLGRG
jgi:hypothetical protein